VANETKKAFLGELERRYGALRKLGRSQSLYDLGGGAVRLYIRYSKVHGSNRTFYGLREEDLQRLEGHPSLVCFLWEGQSEPLLAPYEEYEEVFEAASPARDGQYKAMVHLLEDGTELYIARAGRFNVEGHFGWSQLEALLDASRLEHVPDYSHSQIQTLLGAIGAAKGYAVWVPRADRARLDWSLTPHFDCCRGLAIGSRSVESTLEEVDVIWIRRGASRLGAVFEVEHSTPIYSGLLRFNDVHIAAPGLCPRFSIVANDARRGLFVRQLNRPTFQASGLSDLCTFLEYVNVHAWHSRVAGN